jgi:hypothetical protein
LLLVLVLVLVLVLLTIPLLLHVLRPGREVLVQRAEPNLQRRKLREILRVFLNEIHDVPKSGG